MLRDIADKRLHLVVGRDMESVRADALVFFLNHVGRRSVRVGGIEPHGRHPGIEPAVDITVLGLVVVAPAALGLVVQVLAHPHLGADRDQPVDMAIALVAKGSFRGVRAYGRRRRGFGRRRLARRRAQFPPDRRRRFGCGLCFRLDRSGVLHGRHIECAVAVDHRDGERNLPDLLFRSGLGRATRLC